MPETVYIDRDRVPEAVDYIIELYQRTNIGDSYRSVRGYMGIIGLIIGLDEELRWIDGFVGRIDRLRETQSPDESIDLVNDLLERSKVYSQVLARILSIRALEDLLAESMHERGLRIADSTTKSFIEDLRYLAAGITRLDKYRFELSD